MMAKKNEQPLKSSLADKQTRGDRAAIFISNILGSIKFLSGCILFFLIWIVINTNLIRGVAPFDRYPFPALEMVVSIFAIILSVSVLISQNRQGRLEKLRQQVEFEVNVHAETEITKMLRMLHDIQKKLGIHTDDKELEIMKADLDIHQLHRKLDQKDNQST